VAESNEKVNGDSPIARRPGGRTAEVTQRIRTAVLELLLEGGFESCTMKTVAERAGIERSTLYRRYPDRWGAIIDTVIDRIQRETPVVSTGSFAKDLGIVLRGLVAAMATPMGPAIVAAAGALHSEDRVAAARVFFERRMDQLAPMFDAAIERGELAANVDREELFVFATGTLWFNRFIASRPTGEPAVERVVEAVCALYCKPRKRFRVTAKS
jgi:AcrR family transcriptional regulator